MLLLMSYGDKHSIAFKSGTFSVFWKIKIKMFDIRVAEVIAAAANLCPTEDQETEATQI